MGLRYIFGVFTYYLSSYNKGLEEVLLIFLSIEDKTTHSVEHHFRYIQYALNCYRNSWENVVAITGDSCLVNRCLVYRVYLPFINCASHKYNLTVKDKLNEEKGIIQKVHIVLKKVKYGLLFTYLVSLSYFSLCLLMILAGIHHFICLRVTSCSVLFLTN